MNVICLEEKAFYELIERVVERLSEKHNVPPEKWIDGEQAMQKLRIKSTTTLQKLRDEGKIEFSKMGKIILYNSFSIDAYIEQNKKTTF
uniref:Helix-turn-helix domain-containing protein n=1 Tax=Roseihalotalea indica TaxID=2867963 RepID=A0AA49GLF1_9BACT|nr:helix-turn-helix domain-containing protein [Tunicatimonas sp. TK19036]